MSHIEISTTIRIPYYEFEFSYARSSGPGGQNVNKVNSKAVLRWNVLQSFSLKDGVRSRFLQKFAGRISTDGDLIITSDRFRDQGRNREDCIEKLKELLLEVAHPPKIRKKTKPSYSSVKKKQTNKRLQGEKKRHRGKVRSHE